MSTGTQNQTIQGSKPSNRSSAGAAEDVQEDLHKLVNNVGASIHAYCKSRPQVAAMVLFAAGFYVGWKVKPW